MKRFFLVLLAVAVVVCSVAIPLHAKEQDILRTSYLKLPLSFIKNEGQKDKEILFYEQAPGHTTAFTKEGMLIAVSKLGKQKDNNPASSEVLSLQPVTTSSATVEALEKQPGKVNYFVGKDPKAWKTDVSTYGAILYKNVYPGIDMKFYGTNSQLEYDLIVSPKGDPSKIRFAYKGIEKLSLTPSGDLQIQLKEGSLLQKKPHIHQTINGIRREIEGRFILAGDTTFGFAVGSYDRHQPLGNRPGAGVFDVSGWKQPGRSQCHCG